MNFKVGIILRIIGEICDHNRQNYEKNNAQIYEHNSLIPSYTQLDDCDNVLNFCSPTMPCFLCLYHYVALQLFTFVVWLSDLSLIKAMRFYKFMRGKMKWQ